jgi:hypothetical protein
MCVEVGRVVTATRTQERVGLEVIIDRCSQRYVAKRRSVRRSRRPASEVNIAWRTNGRCGVHVVTIRRALAVYLLSLARFQFSRNLTSCQIHVWRSAELR